MVTPQWTIWWRRAQQPFAPADLPEAEATLVAEETMAIVLGGLLSSGARWVDDPFVVLRAEHTLLQLTAARRLGLRVPATCATNNPEKAAEFAASGLTLAKAISGGTGLTPFADLIDVGDTQRVRSGATVLQRYVPASDDLRVVVVDSAVIVWKRPRSPEEPIDWRSADPSGSAFALTDASLSRDLVGAAVNMNRELGLTVSVQDWIVPADGGPLVFLEANPAGSWLFLTGAQELVAPVLARHLERPDKAEFRGSSAGAGR
jgi:glutathione synthase/RimK-type ligase-like ATP-grasp enzyme